MIEQQKKSVKREKRAEWKRPEVRRMKAGDAGNGWRYRRRRRFFLTAPQF